LKPSTFTNVHQSKSSYFAIQSEKKKNEK